MSVASLFGTTTLRESPLDGSIASPGVQITAAGGGGAAVQTTRTSDFLTVQSLANFGAMTGAISAAWKALQTLDSRFSALWVPYAFAGAFALVSLITSWGALAAEPGATPPLPKVLEAAFISIINGLVLASAVVGAETATDGAGTVTGDA